MKLIVKDVHDRIRPAMVDYKYSHVMVRMVNDLNDNQVSIVAHFDKDGIYVCYGSLTKVGRLVGMPHFISIYNDKVYGKHLK